MKKILSKLFIPFKPIAKFFVVAYAQYSYNKMVKLANERHDIITNGSCGYTQYVVLLPEKAQITVINRNTFRKHKRLITFEGKKMKIDTRNMLDLRKGCLYHTADKANNAPMSAFDKEIRRLAFIKLIIKKANL